MAIKYIDAKTLKAWMEGDKAVIVDVREPAEYSYERIHGSFLVPLGSLNKGMLPKLTKGKKLVIHCNTGRRGNNACEKLVAEDPELEIYNLKGGITAWAEAGYPVISSGKLFIPIERQFQITLGTIVFIGTLLTYFVSPWFMLFTGFIGAGLICAGFTGFCSLTYLISRMPWNQRKINNTNSSK